MEIIWGILLLTACYLGYLMGKGKEIEIPKKLKFMVRNDAQEADTIRKIEKRALDGRR